MRYVLNLLMIAASIVCISAANAAQKTKAQLTTEINTMFPSSGQGLITAAILRQVTQDMVDSAQQINLLNTQTGTSYTFTAADQGHLVTFDNPSPVAVSLPAATGDFGTGWNAIVQNLGAGAVTITVTAGSINGGSSLSLVQGQVVLIVSGGLNIYRAVVYGTVSAVTCGAGLSGGTITSIGTCSITDTISAGGPIGSTSTVPIITYNSRGQLTTVTSATITPGAVGAVPVTRIVSSGAGLQGGGDLSADRTLSISDVISAASGRGSSSSVPVISFNSRGQLTTVTTAAITPGSISAVPTTRIISSGAGLQGGGDLSADRTLSIADVISAASGRGSSSDVPVISFNSRGQLTTVTTAAITPGSISAVPATRIISSGTGLSGGGDLSADRTLIIASTITAAGPVGSTSSVPVITFNARGQLTTVTSATITPGAISAVPTTRIISSGTGLSGGGDLSADRTLTIANTIVAGGPTGSATQALGITYNARGQLTAVTTATVTPGVLGALALATQNQSFTGGGTTLGNLAAAAAGSFTANCGRGPTQYITAATSAWAITAPVADGACIIKVTNPTSAVTPSFSGFTVGSNTGATMTTAANAIFSIQIWRIVGTSAYQIFAHQ